jgi:hypothetical protein
MHDGGTTSTELAGRAWSVSRTPSATAQPGQDA